MEFPEPDAEKSSLPDLKMAFTIAFVAFLFAGPRLIEGSTFVLLLAARWLYGRWYRARTANAGS